MFSNSPLDKGLVPLSPACQRRSATVAKIADAGRQRCPNALCDNGFTSRASILRVSIVLFEILLDVYLLHVYLLQAYSLRACSLQAYSLQAYLFAERQACKLRPLVTKMQHFAHLIEKLCMRIVVPPAPGIASSMKFRCRRSTKVR